MKYINKIILIALIVLAPAISIGQYCNHFHDKYCDPAESSLFNLNGQSKSALLTKGQSADLNIMVYKNLDYRISICMDEELGDQIIFKVFEIKKVKIDKTIEGRSVVVVEKQKQLFYDNSKDGYANEIIFSVEKSRRLIIQITVPGSGGGNKFLKSKEIGCVGVLIEHMTTPVSGFKGTGF